MSDPNLLVSHKSEYVSIAESSLNFAGAEAVNEEVGCAAGDE